MANAYIVVHAAYLRSMIAKAWQWAKDKGQCRVNSIHQEEEIYILTSETFDMENVQTEEATQSGTMEVQDWFPHVSITFHCLLQDDAGLLIDSDLAGFNSAPDALLKAMGSKDAKNSSGSTGSPSAALVGSTSGVMSFKCLACIPKEA